MKRAALAVAVALAVACRHEAPPTPTVAAASMDLDTAPAAPASGAVDGSRFALREAWFRVERRAGRRRVDLILSEGRAARLCATSEPEDARHVLLRFPERTGLSPGDLRGDPRPDAPVSAHWEARVDHRWQGRAGSVAVRIETATEGQVTGRVRACFGPGAEGCVAGSFQARLCVTELDLDGPLAGNVRGPTPDGGAAP